MYIFFIVVSVCRVLLLVNFEDVYTYMFRNMKHARIR